jgi:hypothetical protein
MLKLLIITLLLLLAGCTIQSEKAEISVCVCSDDWGQTFYVCRCSDD